MEAFGDARIDETSSGRQIVSTSGGGKSVTFGTPSSDFSQLDLAETASRLLDLYDTVSATETTDEDIYNAMMLRLRAVRTVTTRFSSYLP